MRDGDKTRVYSVLRTMGFILIIISGLFLGYLSADLYDKYTDSRNQANKVSDVTEVSSDEVQLNKGATIIYNRVYTKCNEVNTEQSIADENYIGKSKDELEEIFSGWNIMEFSEDKLTLQKSIDSYSPKYYKIGIYENVDQVKMVAIYTYDVEGEEILERVTNTPVQLLHGDEMNNLETGIIVDNKERLYELMENYDE